MRNTLICVLLLSATLCLAGWERIYGGTDADRGYSVVQTEEGFVIAGYTCSFSSTSRFYLIRTDSEGDTIWTQTYSASPRDCWAKSLIKTNDNSFIIAGRKSGNTATWDDIYIVKADSLGESVWTKTYGDAGYDGAMSIAQTFDYGFIIAGYFSHDACLIKTDVNGNALWANVYGGSSTDSANSVVQTIEEGYILAGMTRSFGVDGIDVFIVKTDSYGNTLWTRTYGGSGDECANSIIETSDSNYIVAGRTNSFGAGGYDIYVLKIDTDGDTLWSRTYGGANDEWANSICQSSDGGYAITGYADFPGIGSNVSLLKIDAFGELIWTRTFSRTSNDEGYSIKNTTDGGYIIAGYAGYNDFYVIKTNSLGFTAIEENPPTAKPEAFEISAYPNPFNSAVTITIVIPVGDGSPVPNAAVEETSPLQIEIYDVNGRRVRTLPTDPTGRPSATSLEKGGTDNAPLLKGGQGGSYVWQPHESVTSGVYLVRARFGPSTSSGHRSAQRPDGYSATKRVVYLK